MAQQSTAWPMMSNTAQRAQRMACSRKQLETVAASLCKTPYLLWQSRTQNIPALTMLEDVAYNGIGAGWGQGLHEVGYGGHQLGLRGGLIY